MKVLNLYAGIGGNRKHWEDVEVTAVELDPKIAEIYKDFFPDDNVVIGDAHQYLLDNHQDYDFIWSSPPCPTHSVVNGFLNAQGCKRYPDMNLYQEIIYLDKFHKGGYCVENVMSYYKPLIKPYVRDRHYFWCNFEIEECFKYNSFNTINARSNTRMSTSDNYDALVDLHGFEMPKGVSKTMSVKCLRNCVKPETGNYILNKYRED